MAKSRKDNKGRVLRKGESYRPDENRYHYTYVDTRGVRRYIYAVDLAKLREREEEIKRDQLAGMPGTLNSCSKYNAFAIRDSSDGQLKIVEESGTLLAHISDTYIDYMYTPKGIVYTDEDKKIHLVTILDKENNQDTILYSGESGFINYMTNDENGIYGFIVQDENGESIDIVRLDWNGSPSVLATEEGMLEDVGGSKLSAFGDITAYLWNGDLKVIKTN